MFTKQKQDGFSLMEVSIILIIAGLILGGIFKVKDIIDAEEGRKEYYNAVKNIGSALEEYVLNYGVYPAPASFTTNTTDANYGVPVATANLPAFPADCGGGSAMVNGIFCRRSNVDLNIDADAGPGNSVEETVLIGAVPTTVLGYSASESLDIYNQKFTYAISRSLIDPATFHDGNGTIEVYSNTTFNNALNAVSGHHYVVLSHGRNQWGSYNQSGTAPAGNCPGSLNAMERENCDNDTVFRMATTGTENDFSDLNQKILDAVIDTPANYYDDALYSRDTIAKEKWTRKGLDEVIMTSGDDSDEAKILVGRTDHRGGWPWNRSDQKVQVWIEGKARTENLLTGRLCDDRLDRCVKINDFAAPITDVVMSEGTTPIDKSLRCNNTALLDLNIMGASGGHKGGKSSEMRGVCEGQNRLDPATAGLGGAGTICPNGSNGINPDGTLRCI